MSMSNSRVESAYPDVKQVNDERWVPPLPDAQKPTVRVPACLGCNRLPSGHPGHEVCLRTEILRLRALLALSDEVREAGELILKIRREVKQVMAALPASKGGQVEYLRTGKRDPSSFSQG
jgi:hypothetical protein